MKLVHEERHTNAVDTIGAASLGPVVTLTHGLEDRQL